jgi:PAS domain S-box-containing protein
MKDSLARLAPAVDRELREAANRAAKREASHALRQSELRHRMLWESATDAIIIFDESNRIHFVNPAARRIFGYDPEELLDRDVSILQPKELHLLEREAVEGQLRAGIKRSDWRSIETLGRRKDGTEFPVEVAFTEMELEGGRHLVAFIRDITERKRTEGELRATQEQFRVAREIQQHLFPKVAPVLAGFDIGGATFPAEATGGDYFDYLPMSNGRVGIVVGDVTGHGVGPALLMAETRAYLRVLARNYEDLGEVLTRSNCVLAEDVGCERYVTLILVELDSRTQTLTYVNAGHPPGFILGPTGELKMLLRRTGPPLGIRPDTTFSASARITLNHGDLVLFMTDGFEEAMAEDGTLFGIERALEVVRQHRHESAQQMVQALYNEVRAFNKQGPQEDDLTAIVVRVTA